MYDQCVVKWDTAFLVIAFDENLLVEQLPSVLRCILQRGDIILCAQKIRPLQGFLEVQVSKTRGHFCLDS